MTISKTTWTLGALLIIFAALAGYLGVTYTREAAKAKEAANTYEAELQARATSISELEQNLLESTESRDALSRELQAERAKTDEFSRTISGIKSTVSTLEKLQYTDPELLAKYSKVFFLSDTYVPTDLARIPAEYLVSEDRSLELHARVLPHLIQMFEAARKDGIELRAASAYRSFGTQTALKSSYTLSYGSGANRFSADQGYSEHQLGTTLDLSTRELGSAFTTIDTTPAYTWLTENAYRFGFVLSYPKGNMYYQYEPWHWRFVGERLARDLHKDNKHLYELTQRELDEYLVYIFD